MSEERKRATRRQAVAAWLAIGLGARICLAAVIGLGSLVMNLTTGPGFGATGDPSIDAFQQDLQQLSRDWMPVLAPVTVARLPTAAALVLAAWMLLTARRRATAVALGVGVTAALLELASGVVGLVMGYQSAEVVTQMMEGALATSGDVPPDMSSIMEIAQWAGLAINGVILLIKLGVIALMLMLVAFPGRPPAPPPAQARLTR